MRIGTKSLLYGAHAMWLHPFMVALAWYKIYGFGSYRWTLTWTNPNRIKSKSLDVSLYDWRLWVCFFVHDIGYWRSPDMDGLCGSLHPACGGVLLLRFFRDFMWSLLCCLHSKSYARTLNYPTSPLYEADKLATALVPTFLYVAMTRATGEIREYKSAPKHGWVGKGFDEDSWSNDLTWFRALKKMTKEEFLGTPRSQYHESSGQASKEERS